MEAMIQSQTGPQHVSFDHALRIGRSPRDDGSSIRVSVRNQTVSSDQLRLSVVAVDRVKVENFGSRTIRFEMPIEDPVPPNAGGEVQYTEVAVPFRIKVGDVIIEVSDSATELLGGTELATLNVAGAFSPRSLSPTNTQDILRWCEELTSVLQAAAGSDQFYNEAAEAVVKTIGLDSGLVMLRRDDQWHEVARHSSNPRLTPAVSHTILQRVLDERCTIYQDAVSVGIASLQSVSGFVAAPIFSRDQHRILGVLYGFRFGQADGQPVKKHEAQLARVLASAIASGMSRVASEEEAVRRHVQLEQFVSPQVVTELDKNPEALQGRDVEITTLFADIRNFSSISERLEAAELCEVIRSIMDCLAGHVREYSGTTCSFLGDGLLAIWNAPISQANHAELACKAALAMQADMPKLNSLWSNRVGGEVGVGIGINTGVAMVGNTGARFKPQYGPLGDSVNLASRVEGATKKLGVPILITGETQGLISATFGTRKLCRVRVVGRSTPVTLFELHGDGPSQRWLRMRSQFEDALEHFEHARWRDALSTLYPLTEGEALDQPSLTLLARTIECLKTPPEQFDPVWDFFSK